MELMLVLAPYNEAALNLLTQASPPVVASQFTVTETLTEYPEEFLQVLQAAAAALSDVDLSASQAAAVASRGIPMLGGATNPIEAVYKAVWATIMEAVKARAVEQKRSLFLAPFADIEGKYHKPPVEEEVIARVTKNLEARSYQEISWHRADGRVMLRCTW
jgi:hypothetical protein